MLAGLLFGWQSAALWLAGVALALPAITGMSASTRQASTGLPVGGDAPITDAGGVALAIQPGGQGAVPRASTPLA